MEVIGVTGTFILYMGLALAEACLICKMCYSNMKSIRKTAFFLGLMLPVLLATFRGTTGTDSGMYRRAYEYGDVSRWVDFEVGFQTLMNFLNWMHMPYQMLFFVMSLGTTLPILLAIKKKGNVIDVRLAVVVWILDFYLSSYNGMRQALAISLCIYAFLLFFDNKKIFAFSLIVLACTFHSSALMCFLIIVGKVLFDSRHSKLLIGIAVSAALFLVLHRDVFGALVKLVTGSSYYASYITRDAYTDGSIFNYFLKISPILIVSSLNFQNYRKDRDFKVLYAMMILGYIVTSLGYVTGTQVGRIGAYFSNLSILVLAFSGKYNMYIGKSKFIKAKNVRILLYLYSCIVFFYDTFYRGFSDLVPYLGCLG